MRVPESAGGTCDVDAHQEPAIPALHLQHLDRGADAVERDPELAEDPGPVAPQRQRATGGPQMSGALEDGHFVTVPAQCTGSAQAPDSRSDDQHPHGDLQAYTRPTPVSPDSVPPGYCGAVLPSRQARAEWRDHCHPPKPA